MIEVKHLTKRYGDHNAVDDLSFTVEDGQIYGFLGPNGAGKSTTMNMMTGFIAPTSGEIIINGHDILEEAEEAKKTIGYLPEIPPVYVDMTVDEYLHFCAELKKVPKKERGDQVKTVMEELELTDMKHRLIKNLSKGYRQRVGFAQALLGNPETLILDEPTVGLDPKQILEIRSLIKRLGEKHTVILSSHILSEVSEVCDQVLIINHGKFIACDTPENLEKSRDNGSLLIVTAEGSMETVLKALQSVVENLTEDALVDKNDSVEAAIQVPADLDIRGQISQALFTAGCPVLEMKTKKANLEDIFLELTGDSDAMSDEDALVHDETADLDIEDESPNADESAEADLITEADETMEDDKEADA